MHCCSFSGDELYPVVIKEYVSPYNKRVCLSYAYDTDT